MSREERVKLLLAPTLGPLRTVLGLLRALPWPTPLQRITQRGLERLSARIPELADLLEGRQRARRTVQATGPVSSLPELLTQLQARDYQLRARAVQGLSSHRTADAVAALVTALRDKSVEVAVAAATALSTLGGPEARDALLALLDNSERFYHPLARAAAVHGLGTLLPSDQREPLLRALRDVDAEVSIAAIGALSARSEHDDPGALLAVVANEDGFYLPITRLAAARALERLPLADTGAPERLLQRERDPLVREVLERLLARRSAS